MLAFATAHLTPAYGNSSPNGVCENLKHCHSLLERHTPADFDYNVLANGFSYFGAEGKDSLITLLPRVPAARQSQILEVLNRLRPQLSHNDVRILFSHWKNNRLSVEDTKLLTDLLSKQHSSVVYQSTLDALERKHQINGARTLIASFPIDMSVQYGRPTDVFRLIEAHKIQPDENFITRIASINTATARDILGAQLAGTHTQSTIIAYQALYDFDRQLAFNKLIESLRSLRSTDIKAAAAISKLIVHRHENRSDGFYLKFANDLAVDANMSTMGRLVGFDVIMRLDAEVTDRTFDINRYILGLSGLHELDIPNGYFTAFKKMSPQDREAAFAALAKYASGSIELRLQLLDSIHQYGKGSDVADKILITELRKTDDYRILNKAIYVSFINVTERNALMFKQAYSHINNQNPILAIQSAAKTAYKLAAENNVSHALRRRNYIKLYNDYNRSVAYQRKTCNPAPTNMKALSKKMPFYLPVTHKTGSRTLRTWLQTAMRFPSGWLAGYKFPNGDGALIAYDYNTEKGIDIGADNIVGAVTAILPIQNSKSYWIVTDDNEHIRIYRLRDAMVPLKQLSTHIDLQLILPGPFKAVSNQGHNGIVFTFEGLQSPIRLFPTGRIAEGCGALSQSGPNSPKAAILN